MSPISAATNLPTIAAMAEGLGFGTILPQAITFTPYPALGAQDHFISVTPDGQIEAKMDTSHPLFSLVDGDFNPEGKDTSELEEELTENTDSFRAHETEDREEALEIALERLSNPILFTPEAIRAEDDLVLSLTTALGDVAFTGDTLSRIQGYGQKIFTTTSVAFFYLSGLAYIRKGLRTDNFEDVIENIERVMTSSEDGFLKGDELLSALLLKATACELCADQALLNIAKEVEDGKQPWQPVINLQNAIRLYGDAAASMTTVGRLFTISAGSLDERSTFEKEIKRIDHKSAMLYVSLLDHAEGFSELK